MIMKIAVSIILAIPSCLLTLLLFSQLENSPLFRVLEPYPSIEFSILSLVLISYGGIYFGSLKLSARLLVSLLLIAPSLSQIPYRLVIQGALLTVLIRYCTSKRSKKFLQFTSISFSPGVAVITLAFSFAFIGSFIGSLPHYVDLQLLYQNITTRPFSATIIKVVQSLGSSLEPLQLCLEILSLILLGSLLNLLYGKKILYRAFTIATRDALYFCLLFLILQIFHFHPLFLVNQTAFWEFTQRRSGTFSDPNAAGIILTFFYAIISVRTKFRSIKSKFQGTLIIVAALFSASRISLLLILLLSVWIFLRRLKQRKARSRAMPLKYISLILGGCLMILLSSYFLLGSASTTAFTPQGIQRILKTINPESMREMLHSRLIYWQIAYEAFLQKPYLGHGLGKFYDLQTIFAKGISIELGTWRDNANSLYLQILSEQGIFGLFLVFFPLFFLIKNQPNSLQNRNFTSIQKFSNFLLFIFLVAAITGPHHLFPEVRFVLTYLLALSYVPLENKSFAGLSRKALYAFLCISSLFYLFCQVYTVPSSETYGLYPKEWNEKGDYHFRWTGSFAHVHVCPNNRPQFIVLENLAPLKLSAQVYVEGGPKTTLYFDLGEFVLVPIGEESEFIEISLTRPWNPYQLNAVSDYRTLGLAVHWPGEETCLSN